MNYTECKELIEFINRRVPKWYTWAIDITWGKLKKWRDILDGMHKED